VALDEPRDRRVIRMLLRGDNAEGDVLDARALDLREERIPRA
jgi:hypothetical protein